MKRYLIVKYTPPFLVSLIQLWLTKMYKVSFRIFRHIDIGDIHTVEIYKRVLKKTSNCIDVGAHKGLLLKEVIRVAPMGHHFAFEPIPNLFKRLYRKYHRKANIMNIALANFSGETDFIHFIDRPALSGILRRETGDSFYRTKRIRVKVGLADTLIPVDLPVNLIKIDVEGGEFEVLKGCEKIIRKYKPIILFEFGKEGAGVYGTDAGVVFDFLTSCGLSVSLPVYYLDRKLPYSREEFIGQYDKGYSCFFIAYPLT